MDLVKSIQLLIILLSFAQESRIQILGLSSLRIETISQNIDLSDITVGDRITYALIIEHDKDTQLLNPKPITFASLNRLASEHFEAHGPEVKRLKARATQRGKILTLIEYKLTVYEPGTYNIPPIIIKCLDASGREFSVMSKPLGFRVRSVMPNGARTIRDIKGSESVPRNTAPYILILGIFVIGLSVAAYFYFKRYKKFVTVKPETVILQRLPHEIALEELREIELMDLVAKGEMKEHYIRVSEVIRRYIEKCYGIAALELTTAKVLDALETHQHFNKPHLILECNDSIVSNEGSSPLSLLYQRGDLIGKIGNFLNACDSVKFAKYQPSANEADNLLQQAREIVELGIAAQEGF